MPVGAHVAERHFGAVQSCLQHFGCELSNHRRAVCCEELPAQRGALPGGRLQTTGW